MKSKTRIDGKSILGSLILSCAVLVSGCFYYSPDFEMTSHPELQKPLEGSIAKKKPFSVPRRYVVGKEGKYSANFTLALEGKKIWFEEFRFGDTATEWRFVLFAPDGKTIICGNEWSQTDKNSISCDLDPMYIGKPLSADIDFRLPGDSKDSFRWAGRVFYFVEGMPESELAHNHKVER